MKISVDEVARIQAMASVRRPNGSSTNGNGTDGVGNGHTPAASVEISARSQEIQQIKKIISSLPEERDDLVATLSQRVQSGSYQVSGSDIADLMMRRAIADQVR